MISAPSEVLTVFPRSFALIITYPSIKRRIFSALLGLLLTLSPAVNAGTKALTIVVFGDSISAAYGIQTDQGWVSLLSDRLKNQYPHYTVVNASVSGETTGGGLTRLPKTLAIHQPDILILELGGNDGLRGYPIEKITGNLSKMISEAQSAGSTVLLIGMVLPPNYGRRYTQSFERLYGYDTNSTRWHTSDGRSTTQTARRYLARFRTSVEESFLIAKLFFTITPVWHDLAEQTKKILVM